MKRHIQTFFGGALIIIPFAITGYFVWWLATKLGVFGKALLEDQEWVKWLNRDYAPLGEVLSWVVGFIVVVCVIYLVGMLTKLYIFRKLVELAERWITHVPGVKTIYESVRDLMKLFGGDSSRMGRAVLYEIPGTEISLLGIMTNEQPAGVPADGRRKVAVYLPFSYMFGGPTIYVSADNLQDPGITVDQALKLCATAHVGVHPKQARVEKEEPLPETKI